MMVSTERRLKQLRDLVDQLERLPASAERDRMLREVRGRLVDVDTGVTPRAMMPVDEADRPRSVPRRPEPAPRPEAAPRREPPPRPEPAPTFELTSLGSDELLWLADPPPPARPEQRARPWTRGLRG
jgi:hypothetical protein